MKERPIIMGAESVRAILEERKTQTRRVIKPQPIHMPEGAYIDPYNHNYEHFTAWTLGNKMLLNCGGNIKNTAHWKCPYGVIGDRLWVRETWKPGAWRSDGRVAIDYQASPELTHTPWIFTGNKIKQFIFRWLEEVIESGLERNSEGRYEWKAGMSPLKWKSPIFMPRWASRITLEITDIRVERVRDISEDDAIAEGIISDDEYAYRAGEDNLFPCPRCEGYQVRDAFGHDYGITEVDCTHCNTPKKRYRIIWDSLNAKRGYPWESNPWVWVVSFKVEDV